MIIKVINCNLSNNVDMVYHGGNTSHNNYPFIYMGKMKINIESIYLYKDFLISE